MDGCSSDSEQREQTGLVLILPVWGQRADSGQAVWVLSLRTVCCVRSGLESKKIFSDSQTSSLFYNKTTSINNSVFNKRLNVLFYFIPTWLQMLLILVPVLALKFGQRIIAVKLALLATVAAPSTAHTVCNLQCWCWWIYNLKFIVSFEIMVPWFQPEVDKSCFSFSVNDRLICWLSFADITNCNLLVN